jgi:cytochrome c peroxidase
VTIDTQLRALIAEQGLTGDPTAGRDLPSIDDPLVQLGKLLFFSKSLSGDLDTACASCHHPALGGGDGLSLPVGTGAVDPDVVGPGRRTADGLPNVGRHSQSVFNIGLYDSGMFWDSRVESINKDAGRNGSLSGIRTPDTALNVADTNVAPGMTLPAAQARFPVTVPEEMRGGLLPGADGETVRQRLAARLGNYGAGEGELANNRWLEEFQTAFASSAPAEQLVTFDNIALALAEYQRSMVFVDTPWNAYVRGDNGAISDAAKQGAQLFYGRTADRRFDCAACHGGDFFTDERHTVTGFPQLGPGKGDGTDGDADFGREQQTGDPAHRLAFRTPTLLNLAATAPYSHSGIYETIDEAGGHYFIPDVIFGLLQSRGGVCALRQFQDHPDCATLYPNLSAYSAEAMAAVLALRNSDADLTFPDLSFSPPSDAPPFGAFLGTLTDPCTLDRACLAPWIPTPGEAPDDHQLNAVDGDGNPL